MWWQRAWALPRRLNKPDPLPENADRALSDEQMRHLAQTARQYFRLPEKAEDRLFDAGVAARDEGGGHSEIAKAVDAVVRAFQQPAPTRVLIPEEAVSAVHW